MIIIKKVEMNDIQNLVKFLIKHDLAESINNGTDEYYICKNDDMLCGYGVMERHNDFCMIKDVFVSKENRRDKLGSSIVKTMLNSAELSGAITALCKGNNEEFSFALNFKPIKAENLPDHIKSFIIEKAKNEKIYFTSLVDYFKNACSSCKTKLST
ncbi:MAG: GNAT family N-acetyltransferase [Firmicutes bacterium]|nr:GNAT family N-acetyltransferase [Bacillota bacterium]